jgi:hypothetical protein
VLALAGSTRCSQTDRTADVGSGATRSIKTALARGTADAIAGLVGGAARPTDTGLGGTAADAVAAVLRATVTAGITAVPGRNARAAHSVLADLRAGSAAVCARVTGAIPAGVPHTADRRGGGSGAFEAKAFVLGSITGALTCGWCVGTEHLCAPFGTVPILPERRADAAQTEEATDRGGDNGSQRMPP